MADRQQPKGDGFDLVRYEVHEGVCTLTLHDPKRNNAWSGAMERAYFALLDRAVADTDVRSVVVTGHGRSFCPGQDTRRLEQAAGAPGSHLEGRRSQHYPLLLPKPMVAAINGGCAGVGLMQALVCDVRFASRAARISTAYARLGLSAEHGISWLLPRLIGVERALDLLLSARPIDGREALDIGLVSRLCEPDDLVGEAQDYARELAVACSPRAMASIRRQVWGDLSRSYSESKRVWAESMRELNTDNPDFMEGISALRAKRAPSFASLPRTFDSTVPPPAIASDASLLEPTGTDGEGP
jgi:enoyl-CoA hydratase/carnithine racemase